MIRNRWFSGLSAGLFLVRQAGAVNAQQFSEAAKLRSEATLNDALQFGVR